MSSSLIKAGKRSKVRLIDYPIIQLLQNISIVSEAIFIICDETGFPVELFMDIDTMDIKDFLSMIDENSLSLLKSNVLNYLSQRSYDEKLRIKTVSQNRAVIEYHVNFVSRLDSNNLCCDVSPKHSACDNVHALIIISPILSAKEKQGLRFMSLISHELKTPLISIMGAMELLVRDPLNDSQTSLVTTATRNSERLMHIINDLLSLQSMESGRLTFNIISINLIMVVKQAIADNESYATKHDVIFKSVSKENDIQVLCDPLRTSQMISNYLSNAAKFSPSGATVYIDLFKRGEFAVVEVVDSGEGIEDEFKVHVFDRYAQSEKAMMRKGGSGLGLYITKLIAEKQGGEVGFESVLGEGSRFYFTVPLDTPE